MSQSHDGDELTTLALHRGSRVRDGETPNGPVRVLACDPQYVGTDQYRLIGTDGWITVAGARRRWPVALTPSTGPGGGLA